MRRLNITKLPDSDRRELQTRVDALLELRHAPTATYPNQQIWWPSAPLEARAIPGGIDGSSSDRLAALFTRYSGGHVYVGDLSASKPQISHASTYGAPMCHWVKTELLSSPTCVLSATHDFLIVADEQLRYSIVGAEKSIMQHFEFAFGGPETVRDTFLEYVRDMGVGFDEIDRKWAEDYLVRWSGWEKSDHSRSPGD